MATEEPSLLLTDEEKWKVIDYKPEKYSIREAMDVAAKAQLKKVVDKASGVQGYDMQGDGCLVYQITFKEDEYLALLKEIDGNPD